MRTIFVLLFIIVATSSYCQPSDSYLLQPDRVFDGEQMRAGYSVFIQKDKIVAVGPSNSLKASAGVTVVKLAGCTLMPGLIEGHSHLLLHPYNETSWNDQVLK